MGSLLEILLDSEMIDAACYVVARTFTADVKFFVGLLSGTGGTRRDTDRVSRICFCMFLLDLDIYHCVFCLLGEELQNNPTGSTICLIITAYLFQNSLSRGSRKNVLTLLDSAREFLARKASVAALRQGKDVLRQEKWHDPEMIGKNECTKTRTGQKAKREKNN